MIIVDVEQGTDEWHKARAGIPTASRASDLITSAGELSKSIPRYAESLAADKYAGRPIMGFEGNKYTDFGTETEQEARDYYAFSKGVEVKEIGFCTDDLGRFGCSPDGLVGDDGLVEIKCKPANHIKTLMFWQKNGKPPTDYLAQTHMQMLVTGRQWTDLFYYLPGLPELTIRVERAPEMDKSLNLAITNVIAKRDDIMKTLKEIAA